MSTVLVREIVQLVQYDGWRSTTGIHRNSGLKAPTTRRSNFGLMHFDHISKLFAIILSPDISSDIYIKYGLSFYQRI